MALYNITIDVRTNKTRYLLGLISEIAKAEKYITIKPPLKPNRKTLEAIKEVEEGKVYMANDAKDLFRQLNK